MDKVTENIMLFCELLQDLNNPSAVRSPKVNPKESTYMIVIGDLSEIPEDEKGYKFILPNKIEESNFADDFDEN